MKNDPRGKVVLITGGALGMGEEIAKIFARNGAIVVLWDLRKEDLDKTAKEVKAWGGDVFTYVCDVTNRQMVYETAEKVKKEVGPVDVLNNNAGVVYAGPFLEVDDERHLKCVDVNINGILWCTRAFLPDMIKRNQGHIIMMASAAGIVGVGGLAVYCATKHAVVGFSDALRVELKQKEVYGNIGITVVCPSFVQTGMFSGVNPPLLTRWLTTEKMAKKIYKAYQKKRLYIREPLMVKTLPLLKGISLTRMVDRVGIWLGMDESASAWQGRPDQDKHIKT